MDFDLAVVWWRVCYLHRWTWCSILLNWYNTKTS